MIKIGFFLFILFFYFLFSIDRKKNYLTLKYYNFINFQPILIPLTVLESLALPLLFAVITKAKPDAWYSG